MQIDDREEQEIQDGQEPRKQTIYSGRHGKADAASIEEFEANM